MALFARFASAGLRRRLAAVAAATRSKVRRRIDCREQVAALAAIRAALAKAGISPEGISALRFFGEAERSLASDGGDIAARRRADAAFAAADPVLAKCKPAAVEIAARVRDYVGRGPPDPGAAPNAWYVWALATGAAAPAGPAPPC